MSCQKNVVYLHPQFHAGDVCASSAGVADIFKRRLLTLCSDLLESRKFQEIQDLATVDVLRDIDDPSCACFWYVICVYMYAHTRTLTNVARRIFIFGVGFALSVLMYKAMRQPHRVERQQSDSTLFILCLYLT